MRLHAPSSGYWFGTDELGRDVFSRMLYGVRVSLSIGFVSAFISIAIGTVVGLVSGFWRVAGGHRIDARGGRGVVVFLNSVFDSHGLGRAGETQHHGRDDRDRIDVAGLARMVRGFDARTRFPCRRADCAVETPVAVRPSSSQCDLADSRGRDTDRRKRDSDRIRTFIPRLGSSTSDAVVGKCFNVRKRFYSCRVVVVAISGLAILLTVLAFNLLGDGLRDALDPRL